MNHKRILHFKTVNLGQPGHKTGMVSRVSLTVLSKSFSLLRLPWWFVQQVILYSTTSCIALILIWWAYSLTWLFSFFFFLCFWGGRGAGRYCFFLIFSSFKTGNYWRSHISVIIFLWSFKSETPVIENRGILACISADVVCSLYPLPTHHRFLQILHLQCTIWYFLHWGRKWWACCDALLTQIVSYHKCH